MTDFDIGTVITLSETFYNLAGVLTNPSSVIVRIRKPDGTIIEQQETNNPSTGVFTWLVLADQSGRWEVGWKGTGAVAKSSEGHFYVRRSRVLV